MADLEFRGRDSILEEMRVAIEEFKEGKADNAIDKALEILMELPLTRLNDELLIDLNTFISSVWDTQLLWEFKKRKR